MERDIFKKILLVFIISLALISSLMIIINSANKEENEPKEYIKNLINSYKNIKIQNDEIGFSAEYPYFNYALLDNEIANSIEEKEGTNIKYKISNYNQIFNILFIFENNAQKSYKNVVFNTRSENIIKKNALFDFNLLENELLEKVKNKYSKSIYNAIIEDKFENASVDIENKAIKILFNDRIFNVNYDVYIIIGEESEAVINTSYDKVIAFTFDDGPSDYTKSIVQALIANSSEATFFELGSKMKYNQEIVEYLMDNNMEVASHTYSHKNLNIATLKTIEEELNSTNIIFNEITGKNIELTRTPYGKNSDAINNIINTPIIYWSIDTNDWLYRDANKVAKHILEKVKDGDIVLMHDTYSETVEAIKIALPELIARGYKITTVSQLAKEKKVQLTAHVVYTSFN